MRISVPPDSGNISVIHADHSQDIHVHIRPDNRANAYQWFYFVMEGRAHETFVLHIDNAGGASYPGWDQFGVSYRATGSVDDVHWSRLDTKYDRDTGVLTVQGQMTTARMAVAFFPPYSYERHVNLIAKARTLPHCNLSSLGKSVEGRDITVLTCGRSDPNKKHLWVIARQHPGETMAEWYVEGMVEYLASDTDLSDFFQQAVLHIVPNMNPDGTYHGNLRTNALGKDLNRQWSVMDNQNTAPEVYTVRNAILQEGVAAVFDIHGDETHPYVFLNGQNVDCAVDPESCVLEKMFRDAYQQENPYLQSQSCYAMPTSGFSDLNIAKNFFAERVHCMAFTVEMPDKELLLEQTADGTQITRDWTPEDCKQFGAQWFAAVQQVIPRLSNKRWKTPTALTGVNHKLHTFSPIHTFGSGEASHPILGIIMVMTKLFMNFRFLHIV